MLHTDQYSDKDCYDNEEDDHDDNSHHHPNDDSSLHTARACRRKRWCGVKEIDTQEEEKEEEKEEEEEEEEEEMCADTLHLAMDRQ